MTRPAVAALAAITTMLTFAAPGGAQTPVDPVTVTRLATPEKTLQFDVDVPAPLEAVWTAFTTTDGLKTWLWKDARVDLREGGDWLVVFPQSTGGGTIVSFLPKTRLEIAALAPDRFPTVRSTRTKAVFDLSSTTDRLTHVRLTQTGWRSGKEWDDAYEYLATGNAQLLGQLRQRFVSGPIAWPKTHP